MITIFVFGYVFVNSIGSVIGWTFFEYLLFINCITVSFSLVAHNFFSFKSLNQDILSGDLNMLIFRPGNPLIKYLIFTKFSVVVYLMNIFIYTVILYFLYDFNPLVFLNYIPILFLISFSYLIVYFILESVAFFILELGKSLRNTLDQQIVKGVLYFYPANFFEASDLKYFFMFIPLSFITTEVVPILAGKKELNYNVILFLIIFVIIGFIVLNFMWKKGLEKYEAFG
jgi:ABC-type uncharacterized transport system permease subunit